MSLLAAKKKLLMAQKKGLRVQEVFNTSLWTGTGAARTITTGIDSGEGALVWIKARSVAAQHVLVDSIRGAGQVLRSDTSDGNSSFPTSVTAFSASGYALGNYGDVNFSSGTYVGCQFRRSEKFFDIVQYTGNGAASQQITHGLKTTPGIIILKRINDASGWFVYHRQAGITSTYPNYLTLNSTNAVINGVSAAWFAAPTSDDFSIGSAINVSGGTYIAYLFAHDPASEGVIQCGSYVGNGSATGPVVNLGWRPQYVMIKGATGTGSWFIMDTGRGITTGNDAVLFADRSDAELSAQLLDLDISGFQLRASAANTSGQTYIYMAIREAA